MRSPVVVLSGAGVCTASGIPDFRSPGGVWEQFDPLEFTIDRFYDDPDRFWDRRVRLIAAMDYLDAEPNEAHHILARAAREGLVATIITQNVDGLHSKAQTPPEKLIEVHGNGGKCICTACGQREPTLRVLERYETGFAPMCVHCGELLKPDVVLFGEPVYELESAQVAVQSCQTLIVVGTSLQVYPVAGLADLALRGGADLVVCNRDSTPYDPFAKQVLRGDAVTGLATLFPETSVQRSLQ